MAVHGRYTIVGKLADGGMAEIFLGTQHGAEGFAKQVVLKRIHTAFSADPQFRNMFIDEAHISMTLGHGNIVQVLDLGVSNGRYFLVLELVDGWDLDRVLKRARAVSITWPPALSLYVAAEVCRALSYAHAKAQNDRALGIVHRDVSPNNVLLSEHGEVKLADFGIAKAQRKREQTAAGVIKGKVAFMSPEQATGSVIDRRSDLFSVGSMLYLMATDKPPFESATDLESLARVQRADFAPPESVRPTLGPAISRIINRAMRLSASDRYQTADEMLADVERVLRTEYHSAGQTELKHWLAQLYRRDNVPAISKLATNPAAAPPASNGTDLNAGTSFELGDLDLTEVAATPPPMPMPAGGGGGQRPSARNLTPPITTVEGPGKVGEAARARPRRFGGFWLGVIAAVGAVIGLRYLGDWIVHQGWFTRPTVSNKAESLAPEGTAQPTGEPTAEPMPPARKADEAPAPAVPAAPAAAPAKAAEPAVVAAPVVPAAADAGTAAVAPSPAPATVVQAGAGGAPTDDSDPDDPDANEETLLRKADPNASNAVIGEEEAAPAPAPISKKAAVAAKHPPGSAASGKANKPEPDAGKSVAASAKAPVASKSAPAPTPAAKPAAAIITVSLHITSAPVGAVVRIKKRVLGRTPINLRFKTDNIYDLTFVKDGYVSATKRVAVKGRRDGKLAVSLKKQPAPPKSFFHPHR